MKRSDRPLVFYIFCGEQVVFFRSRYCQISDDTSEKVMRRQKMGKLRQKAAEVNNEEAMNVLNTMVQQL